MKLISTLFEKKTIQALAVATTANSQVSLVCTSPANTAYDLTSNGDIYGINNTTAPTIRVIKNNRYRGNSPGNSNGPGFNTFNTKFYYFKIKTNGHPSLEQQSLRG